MYYTERLLTFDEFLIFLDIALFAYTILTLLLPIYSIRKITNSPWIFGILTTLLIPLVLEYMFPTLLTNMIQKNLTFNPIIIESLQNIGQLTDNVIETIKSNPVILKLLNKFLDMLASAEIYKMMNLVGTMKFLCLTSYFIDALLINLKLRLGISKAGDFYLKLNS